MKNKNCFHKFRANDKLSMQNQFIFVDTETTERKTKDGKILKFWLGWGIYWDRIEDKKEYFYFENIKQFWDWIELHFYAKKQEIIMFAHNMDFDFKILNGFDELIVKRKWEFKTAYIEGFRFIVNLEKNGHKLKIWDTMNFLPIQLKKIGKILDLDKLPINFEKDSKQKIKVYCKRDTEIIYKFIRHMIEWLIENNLSQLKPTIASLSLNIFRHKFYSKNNEIFIHNHKRVIQLERHSYRGGIADCFKVGKFKEQIVKTDITSMYPFFMKTKKLPVKLVGYYNQFEYKQSKIDKMFNKYLNNNDFSIIANCKINLPQKYAYILVKTKNKSMFMKGEFNITLTSPELQYVEKHGKILEIKELSIYENKYIFNDFVDFFIKMKEKATKENNLIERTFAKLIMNSQYGKWGSKKHNLKLIKKTKEPKVESIKYIMADKTETLMQFGYKQYLFESTNENTYDTFVAIPSLITAYSRMYLVNLIEIAERKNVYYADTDSLFCNKKGFKQLKKEGYIDKYKIGLLKVEDISKKNSYSEFLKPKMYSFNNVSKCKGVKRTASVILNKKDEIIYKQEMFQRFKTAIKNNNLDKQLITQQIKHISKIYDKGIIKNKCVYPYEVMKNDK